MDAGWENQRYTERQSRLLVNFLNFIFLKEKIKNLQQKYFFKSPKCFLVRNKKKFWNLTNNLEN